ncbi:MAG: DUF1579 family protein [Phycisphaerae bacterium]|nr:DUF1579 family protein [Phycisphaerae bacterium]
MTRHGIDGSRMERGRRFIVAMAVLAAAAPVGLGVLGSWISAGGGAPPEDRPEYAIDKATLRTLIERAGSPVEEHRALSPMVGAFDGVTTLRSGPGASPITTRSIVSSSWMMEGRFVRMIGTPALDEELPIESMHVLGFDRRAGQYFCWSIDSTDTYGLVSRGTVDEADGAIVLHGRSESTGGTPEPFRQTILIESADRFTMRVWLRSSEGGRTDDPPDLRQGSRPSPQSGRGWFMAVESVYTRRP